MDLLKEAKALHREVISQREAGNEGVALWLEELLNIKEARLAVEVFMASWDDEGDGDDGVFAVCIGCEKELLYSEQEQVKIAYNLPGVTSVPQCVCVSCHEKNPEKYDNFYVRLMNQIESGEFDAGCPRCNRIDSLMEDNGTVRCGNCGLQFNTEPT